MAGLTRDDHDPQTFHVEWATLAGGLALLRRGRKVSVDPFLVARAVKAAMRACPNRTATGSPLVWNDYAVFLDLGDWTRIKKLEATLVRDLGGVAEQQLAALGAEMVGPLNVRLIRDESGSVRPGGAVIKADFIEQERLSPADPSELTVRVGRPMSAGALGAPATVRVPDGDNGGGLLVEWPRGSASVAPGTRIVLGRAHRPSSPGFVPLSGASTRINKRQLWIEAGAGGAIIGRFSQANPVEVAGRLIQKGGQIAVDRFPLDVSLSSGELSLTVHRVERH
jgi:hypothetical protein